MYSSCPGPGGLNKIRTPGRSIRYSSRCRLVGNPVVVEGKTYGIPTYLWVKGGFWYFQSVFDANGLEKPETWDEFDALMVI